MNHCRICHSDYTGNHACYINDCARRLCEKCEVSPTLASIIETNNYCSNCGYKLKYKLKLK